MHDVSLKSNQPGQVKFNSTWFNAVIYDQESSPSGLRKVTVTYSLPARQADIVSLTAFIPEFRVNWIKSPDLGYCSPKMSISLNNANFEEAATPPELSLGELRRQSSTASDLTDNFEDDKEFWDWFERERRES